MILTADTDREMQGHAKVILGMQRIETIRDLVAVRRRKPFTPTTVTAESPVSATRS